MIFISLFKTTLKNCALSYYYHDPFFISVYIYLILSLPFRFLIFLNFFVLDMFLVDSI